MPIQNGNFVKDSSEDLYSRAVTNIRNSFGADTAVSDEDFYGMTARVWAQLELESQNSEEALYFSYFWQTAQGQQLDDLAFPAVRLRASKSSGIAVFNLASGHSGVTIPEMTRLTTDNDISFLTSEEAVASSGDTTIEVNIVSVGIGKGQNVAGNTVLNPDNAITDVDSVTVKENIINGRDAETDTEFRVRHFNSQQRVSSGLFSDFVDETVKNASQDILFTRSYYNNTDTADAFNVPSNGYEMIVRFSTMLQSSREAAARALASVIPPWVSSKSSSNAFTLVSDSGNTYTYYLTIAEIEPAEITYEIDVDDTWTASDEAILKRRIIEYIGGVFTPSSGDSESYDGEINFVGGEVLLPKLEGLVFELLSENRIGGLLRVSSITLVADSKTIGGTSGNTIFALDRDKFFSINNSNITVTASVVSRGSLTA